MSADRSTRALRGVRRPDVLVGVLVVALGAFLYSRFELYSYMIRDSSIYIYGGQQVLQGRPPYVSEMDPKGPISSILASAGVAVARLFGRDDVVTVRLEFCAIALVGVLGLYLLVLQLWGSVTAAAAAAVAFLAFRNFAYNAMVGTDGHIPGVVFLILATWLTARRSWYWAGVVSALAFLTWQPLFFYPLLTVLCAFAWSRGERRRTLGVHVAGLATPVVALVVYYLASSHPRDLLDGLILYPVTGVQRAPATVGYRIKAFARAIGNLYGIGGALLFWIGLALLVLAAVAKVVLARSRWRAALVSPVVLLLLVPLLYQLAYVGYDYIGYPHTWPLLPYATVGLGLGVAHVLRRLPRVQVQRVGVAVLAVALAGLAVASTLDYDTARPTDSGLRAQQAGACVLREALVPHTPLWVIDDPVPLVLLRRRQPDNYPYVGGGLDIWKVDHTTGGFDGWTSQIRNSHASIVLLDAWVSGRYKKPFMDWLYYHGYEKGYIGNWRVYATKQARLRMRQKGILLARRRSAYPVRTDGTRITSTRCLAGGG